MIQDILMNFFLDCISYPFQRLEIPFPKVGKIKESMTQWEKNRKSERTERAKQYGFVPVAEKILVSRT